MAVRLVRGGSQRLRPIIETQQPLIAMDQGRNLITITMESLGVRHRPRLPAIRGESIDLGDDVVLPGPDIIR